MENQIKIRKIIIAAVLIVIVLGLVGIALTSLGTARMKSGSSNDMAPGMAAYDSDFMEQSLSPAREAKGIAPEATRREVIQTASLSLVVEQAETAVEQITQVAKNSGGFVESSQVNESGSGSKYASMTVRVPSASLTGVLNQIKNLATKVSSEKLNAEDVTAQLVDMEARLKNLRAEEEQYRGLMDRSGKIEEVLAVVNELSRVRGEIERLEASRKYMTEQVAMSAIQISLSSVADAQVAGIVWRPLSTAKEAFYDLLSGLAKLADWLIRALIKLPLYLISLAILVLVIWVVWKVWRWLKIKFFSPAL